MEAKIFPYFVIPLFTPRLNLPFLLRLLGYRSLWETALCCICVDSTLFAFYKHVACLRRTGGSKNLVE